MNIELNHFFKLNCHDLKGLLKDCNKLSAYCSRLEKQSLLFPNRYDPNKYKGDGFELFCEALIKFSPIDNRIGITNYRVVEGQDIGVDGFGIGMNGFPITVQCKYRTINDSLLTANQDHLSNFTSASVLHYEVRKEDTKNMLILTTAKGLHHFTDAEMFKNKVRCLGFKQLRSLVDKNNLFWDLFRESCNVSNT